MKKRSSYRPRPVLQDPLGYVLEGLRPLTDFGDTSLKARLQNESSLRAVIDGTAKKYDLDILINMSNMATALSRKHGVDWRAEIIQAAWVIDTMQKRLRKWGKVQATPSEIESLTLLADIHDAQLDAAAVVDVEKALRIVKKNVAKIREEA